MKNLKIMRIGAELPCYRKHEIILHFIMLIHITIIVGTKLKDKSLFFIFQMRYFSFSPLNCELKDKNYKNYMKILANVQISSVFLYNFIHSGYFSIGSIVQSQTTCIICYIFLRFINLSYGGFTFLRQH